MQNYKKYGIIRQKGTVMEIKLGHMSAETAWKHILQNHSMYHKNLKQFKQYTYDFLIPDDKRIGEMFDQTTLSVEQINHYHDIFVNEIYNVADLSKQDENIKIAVQHLKKLIENRIKPLLPAWNAKLPDTLAIQCAYGYGAGYIEGDNAIINLRVSKNKDNDYGIYSTLAHELIHILIEQPIIQKYKVPQDLKEGIVEIIGFELFDKNHHKQRFANSFIESYITPETIKTDFPGAVAKMMTDYMAEKETDFSTQYEPLKIAKQDIQKQIDMLVAKDAKANLAQINELVDKRDAYRAAIIELINEGSDKAFEEYAKKLFDMSIYVIGKNLSAQAIKFDKLSVDEKLEFLQAFINHIAARFKVAPNKLVYKDDIPDGVGAEYDDKTDNININKKDITKPFANLQYMVGMLLHEFTHYLYHKHPDKSPIGKEKALAAVAESYNGYRNLDEYKQKPFEAVAYYVQDYFEKHKFYEQLLSLITPTPDHER